MSSRLWTTPGWARADVFSCPACGATTRLRTAGSPHDPHIKIEGHPPGPGLVPPCPFHRWDRVTITRDGVARCGCQAAAA